MAKLGFVFVPVVKTLYPVVRPPASLVLWTLLRLSEFAKLRRVQLVVSSLVLDAMEEEAALVVMRIASIRTFEALEVTQQQVLDHYGLFGLVVGLLELDEHLAILAIAVVVGKTRLDYLRAVFNECFQVKPVSRIASA